MSRLLQGVFSGLAIGSIYSLVAVGFSFIFASMRIVNFAQGHWAMLAGMAAASVATGFAGLVGGIVAGVLVGGLLGFIVYWLFIGRSKSADIVTVSLLLIGTTLLTESLALQIWGPTPKGLSMLTTVPPLRLAGAAIPVLTIVIAASSLGLLLMVMAALKYTRIGRAAQAAAENREAAALCGINVSRTLLLAFVLSGTLAGVAGLLSTPITSMSYDAGLTLTLQGFAAGALGGLNKPFGALVGGLAFGMFQGLSAAYIGGSGIGQVVSFAAALLVILVVAPRAYSEQKPRPEDPETFSIDAEREIVRL